MNNWDDLRFVLAVAEAGSLNRAAQRLGVSHATVLRRISAVEEHVGDSVFIKSHRGYELRPDRLALVENAKRVQDVMNAIERELSGEQAQLSGTVRITSTDSLSQTVLPAIIAQISKAYPDLQITVLSSNSHLNFERLSADVTVRPSVKLEENLFGVCVGNLDCALYDGPQKSKRWLGYFGPLARSVPAQWMAQNVPSTEIDHVADSFVVLAEMAASNLGQVILPTVIGENHPQLERASRHLDDWSVPLWVASQRELADTARFQVVRDMLVEALKQNPMSLLRENPAQSG